MDFETNSIYDVEFGWTQATISGASSLAFLIMGGGGILAGKLNDTIGSRILMVASGISLGLGYLLMSYLQAPCQLYLLYGILVGVAFSTHDVITLSTVASWFARRRCMMSGIVKMGTGAGQLVVPLIAATLITVYGWRNTYLIIGAVSLLTIVAVAQVLRRDPQSISPLPDDDSHKAFAAGVGSKEGNESLKAATRMTQFWIMCVVEFATFFCLFTIIVHIVPHAMDLGLPPATAAGVLSTIGGVSVLGRFVMGPASDKIGGKRSLIVCFFLLFCGLLWLQAAKEAWMLFLFAVIYGFAHDGFFIVVSPTVAAKLAVRRQGINQS